MACHGAVRASSGDDGWFPRANSLGVGSGNHQVLKIWAQKRARHHFCHILLVKQSQSPNLWGGDVDPTPREEGQGIVRSSCVSGTVLSPSHLASFHSPKDLTLIVPRVASRKQTNLSKFTWLESESKFVCLHSVSAGPWG